MTQAANTLSIPASRPATPFLSGSELERAKGSYAEDGYLVLRNVISREKLATLAAEMLAEFAKVKAANQVFAGGGGGMIAGHLNSFPGEGSRFIYDSLVEQGVIDLIRTLEPGAHGMPNVGCNLNLPGSVTQHYHADTNYFTEEFIICNIAVVDTEIANGAIDVVPGTQKEFYPYWRFAMQKSRAGIRVPMKQGDLLIRSSNLWHRGMPNKTQTPRPMAALTWEAGGSVTSDPFKGKIAFHPNWYRPNLLGRLRERTFVAAPITYAAYRFAESLMNHKGYTR
jgi:ectoine hydroxylase-related dioxygenase (phytanoyl-CoA dioxygenase family)